MLTRSRSAFRRSEPLDGLQRWQMWCIVLSLVLTQLLTNIWMCVHFLQGHSAQAF